MSSLVEMQAELDLLLKSKAVSMEESAKVEANILHLLQKELPVVAFRVGHMGISVLVEIITSSADCLNADVFALEELKLQTLINNHVQDLKNALAGRSIPELIAIARTNEDKYCTPILEQYLSKKMSASCGAERVEIEAATATSRARINIKGNKTNWYVSCPLDEFVFEKSLEAHIKRHLVAQGANEVKKVSNINVQDVIARLNSIAKAANELEWNDLQRIKELEALEREIHKQLSLLVDVHSVVLCTHRSKKIAQISLHKAANIKDQLGVISTIPLNDFDLNAYLFAPYCKQEGTANPFDFL